MTINRWYFPSWTGDFRLKSAEDSGYRDQVDSDSCVLEIVDPVPHEEVVIDSFLEHCRREKWTPIKKLALATDGEGRLRQEILLATPLTVAASALYQFVRPADRTLTALRSEGGKITVYETSELPKLIAAAEPEPEIAVEVVEPDAVIEKPAKKSDAAAVSVRRPTPCCPECVPGPTNRASEVLHEFLSPSDRQLWHTEKALVVRGGLSGHRYVLAHRHSDLAVQFGRICYDLDDEFVVHFHDNSVPPEEEVLAAKLILEHREPWLRNEATTFGSGKERFKNPFGDIRDGTWDAGLMHRLGNLFRALG